MCPVSSPEVVDAVSDAVSSLVGTAVESGLVVLGVLGAGVGGAGGVGGTGGETVLGVGGATVGFGVTVVGGTLGVTEVGGMAAVVSVAVVEVAALLVALGLVPLEQDNDALAAPNTPSSVNREQSVGDEVEWIMFETADGETMLERVTLSA